MIKITDRKNFLFIITDQQRKDHLSCYNPYMKLKTPNIDKIARDGIRFTNFYCNNPICMPNRSTIFTGQYPSIHGVITNGRNLPQGTQTFLDILIESNVYYTASFGKIHLNYFGMDKIGKKRPQQSQEFFPKRYYRKLTSFSPYFGLKETKIISGHGIYTGHPDYYNWVISKINLDESLQMRLQIDPNDSNKVILDKFLNLYSLAPKNRDSNNSLQILKHEIPEELYSTTFVKENTINFLNKFARNHYDSKNFFVFCSFPDPHHPFSPPGKYFNMYNPRDVELPNSFNDEHKNSCSVCKDHYSGYLTTEGTEHDFPIPKDLSEFDAKQCIAASYGMEKMIDDAVGEILNALEKLGLAENTVVIYTTDHGDLGGDHKFFFKGPFLYRGLLNIPFLIKIPNGINNEVCESLASSIDIPETILELAGFSIPKKMQGKSLVPMLKDTKLSLNKDILIEMNDEFINHKTRTLITNKWRISIFKDSGQLYNIKEDPDEMSNLWDDNLYKDTKLELLLKLLRKITINQERILIRDCGY